MGDPSLRSGRQKRKAQDVEKFLKDFSEKHQDLLYYRVRDVKVEEHKRYVMACIGYSDRTGTIFVNKKYEASLISALQNFKNKVQLIKEEEGILLTLWHELTHLRTKDLFKFEPSEGDRRIIETMTEFIARHTYDEFFNMLRPKAKPNYQKEFIKNFLVYGTYVRRFRYVLQTFKINEKEAVEELKGILFEDIQNIHGRLVNWLSTKTGLPEILSGNIIWDMVNDRVSDKEFQKEVKEYAKKRRK